MSAGKVDLKVVLLGRAAVGKTALIDRFLHNRFSLTGTTPTVGAAYGVKQVQVTDKQGKQKNVCIGIWDTAGSERFVSHFSSACSAYGVYNILIWSI